MPRVRTVRSIDDFVGAPDDPDGYAEHVAALWESGQGRPEWCFVVEDGARRVGRVGFRVAPTTTDPAWLGSLPPTELFVYGLDLPWQDGEMALGSHLFAQALSEIRDEVPALLEWRVNREIHAAHEDMNRLATRLGFSPFQEKQGFRWEDDGGMIPVPDRLDFRAIDQTGAGAYRSVMGACGEGTLDRNDRYYWGGCGPRNWAAQMLDVMDEDDASMWLLGYAGDAAAGYVAVSSDDRLGATIAHIGVCPEWRGRGFVGDLLAAGTAAAQRRGIRSMLSDVDVENQPMMAAMRTAGHRDAEWHVWVWRSEVAAMADRSSSAG